MNPTAHYSSGFYGIPCFGIAGIRNFPKLKTSFKPSYPRLFVLVKIPTSEFVGTLHKKKVVAQGCSRETSALKSQPDTYDFRP